MAAVDKRELILVRLLAILSAMTDQFGSNVFRNRGSLDDDQKPGAVLLDGSEELRLGPREGTVGPSIYALKPQIFVILKPRDNNDNLKLDGVDKTIGPELSEYRVKVLRAILNDDPLNGLLGSNGAISLLRSETDMQTGSTMEGMLQMDFALNYVFDPRQL